MEIITANAKGLLIIIMLETLSHWLSGKASASRVGDAVISARLSWSICTNGLETLTLVATPSDVWHYRANARTGGPSVSML